MKNYFQSVPPPSKVPCGPHGQRPLDHLFSHESSMEECWARMCNFETSSPTRAPAGSFIPVVSFPHQYFHPRPPLYQGSKQGGATRALSQHTKMQKAPKSRGESTGEWEDNIAFSVLKPQTFSLFSGTPCSLPPFSWQAYIQIINERRRKQKQAL